MKAYTLLKSSRLLNTHDFDNVFANKAKVINKHFVVYYRLSENKPARLGIIASKKQIKKANQRNRIKRLTREYFRLHQAVLRNIEIIVIARHTCLTENNTTLTKSLAHLLEKVRIKCANS